jgi:hypothetical protein
MSKLANGVPPAPLPCHRSSVGGQGEHERKEEIGGIGKIIGVEGLEGSKRLEWTGRFG